jgi:peptide deformylase
VADSFEGCLKYVSDLDKNKKLPSSIIQLGNPLLRQSAEPVEDITSHEIQSLIQELILTCQNAKGVGIAAPQIGISKAIMIMASSPSDVDRAGMVIEDFGMSHNLMFAQCVVADSFEGCLQYLFEQDKNHKLPSTIIQLGNPLLRAIAEPVEDITSNEIQTLIQELILTCQHAKGVGIAAPQIGIAKAIMIIASNPSERYPNAPKMEPTALINPTIIAHSQTTEKEWEGCLSLPGIRAQVPRYTWVEVSYMTEKGRGK